MGAARDASLQRPGIDAIGLPDQHLADPTLPIEDADGIMTGLVPQRW